MATITIYSSKGGCGKTPIAGNIALDRNYLIGTNEANDSYDEILPKDKILNVPYEKEFPNLKNKMDVVFDLSGSVSKSGMSILSAVKQAHVIIVPITRENDRSVKKGIYTIRDIVKINPNIVVVATKLKKVHNEDSFGDDWTKSQHFNEIKDAVDHYFGNYNIPVLPSKYTTAYDDVFSSGKSIAQIMKEDKLKAYSYRVPGKQFDEIMKVVEKYDER